MGEQTQESGSRYAIVLPNQHYRDELREALNGLAGIVPIHDSIANVPESAKLFDLSQA